MSEADLGRCSENRPERIKCVLHLLVALIAEARLARRPEERR